ncbi:MAG: cryptochrome/photolyase family protein, partial [Bacteroidota bacterium]
MEKALRLVLGDQLNAQHSWFSETDGSVTYVLMEMRQATDHVRHHVQKVVAFFLAMRAFADKLEEEGHQVIYLKLDDENNQQDLTENLKSLIEENEFKRFEYLLPDEYRLDEQLKQFCEGLDIETEAVDSEHFLVGRMYVEKFFEKKKTYLLESFYRQMRKDFDILMESGEPAGGKWNYDAANRKKFNR